ncbi:MAG: DUF354 domain-containing protein [Deltaproteobacteria bacterium]|nr:DUF354 domain-containing protein [Deltaproteobacteria bacterium]
MNFLFELGHPAHVHFFAAALSKLKADGHQVSVFTRNKEITNALLDRLVIPYECLSQQQDGYWNLLIELLGHWHKTRRFLSHQKIDLVVSISGISTTVPARFSGVRNIVFTDTEDAKISNYIAFPFADAIYTPHVFLQHLGSKQCRYTGFHELAYLQGFDFEAAKRVRKELNLPERYIIMRFTASDALHDITLQQAGEDTIARLIEILSAHGQVFITAQKGIPERFRKFQLATPIEKVHAVLAGASGFVGNSPTMAVESACLGTPAFLVTNRASKLGNMQSLESEYGLLRNFNTWNDFLTSFQELPSLGELKAMWQEKADRFRSQMPNMQQFVVETLLNEASKASRVDANDRSLERSAGLG